jgi:hypothetical protein
MSVKNFINDLVGMTTNVSVLLREVAIVVVLCLLFFSPRLFDTMLARVGISKLSTPLGDIDISGAGNAVSTIDRGLSDSVERLQQIQNSLRDAQSKSDIGKVADYLQGLEQQAQTTDKTIKDEVLNRQTTLAQSSQQSTKTPGWLFVGHVDESKTRWSGEGAKNIPSGLTPAQLTAGSKFSVSAAVYLRDDVPSGNHIAGKVVGVVPANGQVQVAEAPEYSSAIAGGYFCWVKVQPL